jgi:phosphate transport system protein
MSVHLQREMERLKKDVLSLCALVEEQVHLAVRALMDRDEALAESVERRDCEIDRQEVEIEEACLKTLALHQPVANDLRFLVAILKINNDLERIGDLAVSISHKAATFAALAPAPVPFDLSGMGEKVQGMLRDSVDSLVNMDPGLAESVCARDDEIDRLKHEIRQWAQKMIEQEPQRIRSLLALDAASRNLERIADHATNIAEDVTYMATGRIVRHGGRD